ncbi:MAG: AI-2E family transporter [Eubacteriales bacterium]|nr:AI-2E family transporter [Eubacteriales bacterium]
MKIHWQNKYVRWGITALLVVIGGLLAYYLIFYGWSFKKHVSTFFQISMPIIDGVIVAWLLCPIVDYLEKRALFPLLQKLQKQFPGLVKREKKLRSVCRGIAIVLTLVFVFFILYGFFSFVIPQIVASIQSIISQFPAYVRNLSQWVEHILANNPSIEKTATELINTYSGSMEKWLNESAMPKINELLRTVSLSMLGVAKALWNLVIGLIISIYLMASKERFISQLKKMTYAFLDTRRANVLLEDCRLINTTFSGFISGKILDSIIIGIICFAGASILKLPYPMLISVIIGVTNIIPFFGPFIGAVPSALLILMVNPVQCLYFIVFVFILQQFDGNFLGPKILGNSTGLSGFWVIFSITLFSGLMGVLGMVLGVPTFAVLYALLKRHINRSLTGKGMPTETTEYSGLEQVDVNTGAFVHRPAPKAGEKQESRFSLKKMLLGHGGKNNNKKE